MNTRNRLRLFLAFLGLFCSRGTFAQNKASFTVIPLGVRGGLDESNLSSYLVATPGTGDYICLDAGTLYAGIHKAIDNGALPPPVSATLRSGIKDYFISHPHLDHVAGLIINSPEDSSKNVYGLASCLKVLQEKYFSWQSWANFANEGEKPALGKYHYTYLTPGSDSNSETAIARTAMYVRAFTLSHGTPYQSTAFLLRRDSAYILYLGDTGADEIEKTDNLRRLWQAVAPLVKTGRLKGIFIEVSYANEQPEKQLFGHLTPRLLMKEMSVLSSFTGPEAIRGLPVLITHIKPAPGVVATIRRELAALNFFHLRLLFPEQAKPLKL